jgi:hypothetical protein
MLQIVTMVKKESGAVRINLDLSNRIKKIINQNNNKLYCDSLTNFVNVAVIQLLEEIERKDNKIRWEKVK